MSYMFKLLDLLWQDICPDMHLQTSSVQKYCQASVPPSAVCFAPFPSLQHILIFNASGFPNPRVATGLLTCCNGCIGGYQDGVVSHALCTQNAWLLSKEN